MGREVVVVHLSFSKSFDAVSHNILIAKFGKCGLDEWIVRYGENWLNDSSEDCDQRHRINMEACS